jgi:uncharacterized protein with GYD domain
VPRYITLMNWTEQGVRGAKETVDRYESAKGQLESVGLRIVDIYWTVGPHDIVTVWDAPDDETMSAGVLGLAGQGNLRSTTMRAFTADEMRVVTGKMS